MNNYNNGEQRISYMGGEPVRCPRCSNVVATRFCPFCSLDLSTVYSKPQEPILTPAPPANFANPTNNIAQPQNQSVAPPMQQPQFQQQQQLNPVQQPFYTQPMQQGQPYNPQFQPPYNNMQYPYYAPKKKNKSGVIALVIILAVLLFFSAIYLGFNSLNYLLDDSAPINPFGDSFTPPQDQEDFLFPGGVSTEEYKKLKVGMSYAQISSIIGGDGEVVNSGETLKKEPYYVYCWFGETNPEALVYITITSDAVTDITIEGTL